MAMCLLLSVIQVSPTVALAAETVDTQAFVAEMQKAYDKNDTLKLTFKQKQKTTIGKVLESAGVAWFKKPGLMRWEYKGENPKLIVAGGGKMWIYQPKERQAMLNSNFQTIMMPEAITFLWGQGKLSEAFEVKRPEGKRYVGNPDEVDFELTPKKSSGYVQKIYIAVNTKDYLIREVLIIDPLGRKNWFRFDQVEPGVKIGKSKFKFKPPKGTEVLNINKAVEAIEKK